MAYCIHCGYSDPQTWPDCPACGQPQQPGSAPLPGGSPPGGPALQHGAGGAPPGPYPPPGQYPAQQPYGQPAPGFPPNPYAAPGVDPSQATYGYQYGYAPALPNSGKAITSMVLGICSIALIYFGIILGPMALGFWAASRSELNADPPRVKGRGMAIAGLVTGIIGTLIGILMVIGVIVLIREKGGPENWN